jgi:hypothetical protein
VAKISYTASLNEEITENRSAMNASRVSCRKGKERNQGKQVFKRQSHEIFYLWFFHKSTTLKPLIDTLKYFDL